MNCLLFLLVLSPQSCALFCQHGSRVEVLEPKGFRKTVGHTLKASVELYQ
jgi:hypothetical protein